MMNKWLQFDQKFETGSLLELNTDVWKTKE